MEDNFKYLSKNVKNYIKRYCRTYCKTLVESYRDIIAERMDYAIEKYYASYDPIYYKRSGKMKNGVYRKYTKTAGNPDVYAGGIILDTRYYGGSYPVSGASTNDIYKWSVLQGFHGREVVGNYSMDNKETIYVDQSGNGSFGTGRKKIWTNKSSLYIQNNHKVISSKISSNEPIIFDSPYNNTLEYNIKAFNKARQIAINKANSILKPGLFW